ncbi:hypothetical protein Dda_7213 [Drechslerella dactyloides]|uniref:Uncharacterized protein n=1 Tax=Drechslerella dactyloides TaxID=74499 RepID=A0AAD6NHF5_DREDA|nr:hypothetical protein Dda_7213 [Drechslerella dactyloides]
MGELASAIVAEAWVRHFADYQADLKAKGWGEDPKGKDLAMACEGHIHKMAFVTTDRQLDDDFGIEMRRRNVVTYTVYWSRKPNPSLPQYTRIGFNEQAGPRYLQHHEYTYAERSLRASHQGHDKIAELLLNSGADLNDQGKYAYNNCSNLSVASFRGHDKVVELLLSKGANVNSNGPYGGALYAASDSGHDKIVELLLRKGANPNSFGLYGSALWGASDRGSYKIVEMLLSKGASIEIIGQNALHAASARGHGKIVDLMLSKSADVND